MTRLSDTFFVTDYTQRPGGKTRIPFWSPFNCCMTSRLLQQEWDLFHWFPSHKALCNPSWKRPKDSEEEGKTETKRRRNKSSRSKTPLLYLKIQRCVTDREKDAKDREWRWEKDKRYISFHSLLRFLLLSRRRNNENQSSSNRMKAINEWEGTYFFSHCFLLRFLQTDNDQFSQRKEE